MRLDLIESHLDTDETFRSYELKFANQSTLDVDDRLAEQLVRLGKLKRIADAVPKIAGSGTGSLRS